MKVAEYSTPSITLVEGDLRSAVTIQTKRSKRDNYNAVKGIFAPSENNFIATDYPAFTSSTFQTEDGGQRQFLDLDLAFFLLFLQWFVVHYFRGRYIMGKSFLLLFYKYFGLLDICR